VKCVSLWQPWASLLVHGKKRCETRSWPTNYHGPLLVHAAKKWNTELAEYAVSPPFRKALEAIGVSFTATEEAARGGWGLPFGAIVGCVQLDHCIETRSIHFTADPAEVRWVGMLNGWQFPISEQPFGDYSPGRFAWYCTKFMPFAEPIPYRGAQGMFDVPGDVVRDAIAKAKGGAA